MKFQSRLFNWLFRDRRPNMWLPAQRFGLATDGYVEVLKWSHLENQCGIHVYEVKHGTRKVRVDSDISYLDLTHWGIGGRLNQFAGDIHG